MLQDISNTDTYKNTAVTNLNTESGKTAAQGIPLQLPVGAYVTKVNNYCYNSSYISWFCCF